MAKEKLKKAGDGATNKPKSDAKQMRLTEALRSNLRRRKQQAKDRKNVES